MYVSFHYISFLLHLHLLKKFRNLTSGAASFRATMSDLMKNVTPNDIKAKLNIPIVSKAQTSTQGKETDHEIITRYVKKDLELIGENSMTSSASTMNARLLSLLSEGEYEAIESIFYNSLQNKGEEPDAMTYTLIINQFCLRGQPAKASFTLDLMKKLGFKPNTMCYNAFMEMYRKQKNIVLANKWFNEIKLARLKPNKVSYNIMISANLSLSPPNIEKANELFYEMKEEFGTLESSTYGIFIEFYLETLGNIPEALKWAKKMDSDGVKFRDSNTKSIVLTLYKRWKEDEIRKKEMKHPRLMLLDAVKDSDERKAEDIWYKMKMNNIPYDVGTYALMIQLYNQNGKHELAIDYYHNMMNQGLLPDKQTLLSMFAIFKRLGDFKECEQIVNMLKDDNFAN